MLRRPADTALSQWWRNSHILLVLAIVCSVNFLDVDLWMSDAKISWRSLKRVHVPIVIIYTKWTWLVFINETTPHISCLLCFNVVGLNCFERKCECEVKFDAWRNTKIISVCIVFQPESISSQQWYSLQPSRYSPCICIVLAPPVLSLLSSEHNNYKSARIHAHTQGDSKISIH